MLPRKSLYKLLAERNQIKAKYFQNYYEYALKIKERAQEILGEVKVLVFGSVVRGDFSPNSDIDILVISSNTPENLFECTKIKLALTKDFEVEVFELHLVRPKIFENWYRNFIKDDFVEI